MIRIRCHFDGNTLVPDEPVELPRGESLVAHVERIEMRTDQPARTADPVGQTRPFFDWAADNVIDDPSLPEDLSRNLDHYLYGSPKREE
jgi:hypothetical protein